MTTEAPAGWFIPGAFIGDPADPKRLRPPLHWSRYVLEIPRVPASMNTNEIRSHWRGFQKHKKSWQEEIGMLLMVEKVKRDTYQRVATGCFLRFPRHAPRRDPLNFSTLINKALGDALTEFRAIPDDDAPHYTFGGVEFQEKAGPARTLIVLYFQPKEHA